MKKVIRLSERDLTRLIKRMVKESMESEVEMSDVDTMETEKVSPNEAKRALADYFKNELFPEIESEYGEEELNRLERMVKRDQMAQMNESENDDSLERRKGLSRSRKMMRGGMGMMGVGALGYLSQLMGYSESETLTMMNDVFQQLHLGEYTGPVMATLFIGGLIMAFRGRSKKFDITGK